VTQTLIQATLIAQLQTATITACDYDFAVVEQDPPDAEFVRANTDYQRSITLLNTGTCPWERNTALTFVDGENFSAPPRIFIREVVEVGEDVTLSFEGRTPSTNGLQSGTWELRTPGQIRIGDPLVISIQVYGG
jgi:hypothetical protein